jgi:hypothetical protein
MCRRSLHKSVTIRNNVLIELTMVEVDISCIESKMLGCFFTTLYCP